MALTFWEKVSNGVGYRLLRLGFRFSRIQGDYPIRKPIDPADLEILGDPRFQASVNETADLTLLDTPRLANLWTLCRMTDPEGSILEVGSYRGGGALHLSNSCPNRKIIVCDSFTGFRTLHSEHDHRFTDDMFKDTSRQEVEQLFSSRGRKYEVVQGFFPASCAGRQLPPVSFVHLDVDVYEATRDALLFLQSILMKRGLIVLDDYNRHADGVNKAVAEFLSAQPGWWAFPLFPGQCLLLNREWFSWRGGRSPE